MQIKIIHISVHDQIDQLNSAWQLLSADERAKAARFKFGHDQQQFILAHALKRRVLSDSLNSQPNNLNFTTNKFGKPSLVDSDLQFNLSHSQGEILLGISRGIPIGVDIEKKRPLDDYRALAQRYFTPTEIAQLQNIEQFYRLWVAKEAIIKAQGVGIANYLDKIEVAVLPDQPAKILQLPADFPDPQQWTLQELSLGEDLAAAVALPTQNAVIEIFAERLDLYPLSV